MINDIQNFAAAFSQASAHCELSFQLSARGKYTTCSGWASDVWSEKLSVAELVNKFPRFSRSWRLITVFTRTRFRAVSWVRWIQPATLHPISLKTALILSPIYVCVSRVVFSVQIFQTKFLCTLHFFYVHIQPQSVDDSLETREENGTARITDRTREKR